MIPWYRSWPRAIPKGRAYVVDEIPHLVLDNYDLADCREFMEIGQNFIMLEWDIAVSLEDREAFARYCIAKPDVVHVAPYLLYEWPTSKLVSKRTWIPLLRRGDGVLQIGFGMIYFPWKVVTDFLTETYDPVRKTTWFTDGEFSRWYKGEVILHSDIRPVHLHYSEGLTA
jgi:hypothetical protein